MWRLRVLSRALMGVSSVCEVSGAHVVARTTTAQVFEAVEHPLHLQVPFGLVWRRSTSTNLSNPRDHHVPPVLVRGLHEFHDDLLSWVQEKLASEAEVKGRQLQLLSSILSDTSEVSKMLVVKLNCEAKLSAEEMYMLAVAVFNAKEKVGQDALEIAAPLFHCSGELGDHNALYTFAQLTRAGQGCRIDTPLAAEMFTQLSMKGHPYAQLALAGMYYTGIGVEQNFKRAFSLYKVASQNFVPEAFNALGSMLQHGQGVKEDVEEAVRHYTQGAELGDALAHLSLASCYTHGRGVRRSYEEAFQHHLTASESGLPVALYNVGGHYFAGKGVELSFHKAAEYYQTAANKGFAPAQVNLGNMYYNGLGVPKNRDRAKQLYKMAAESDRNAKLLLEEMELEEKKEQEEKEKERRQKEDNSDDSSKS